MNLQRNINWNAVLDSQDLSKPVQSHLRAVYFTLTLCVASSALGAWLNFTLHIGNFLTTICAFMLLLWFKFTPYEAHKSQTHRLALLFCFALFQGASLAPLLTYVVSLKDGAGIIAQALGATTAVFGCFSGAALLSERRSWLYLAGFLSSALSTLLWIGLFNLFFRTELLVNVSIYLGLIVFSGFVIFDTQLIVEKANIGDRDYPAHALELFVDFVAIFVRILIILTKNKKKRDDN